MPSINLSRYGDQKKTQVKKSANHTSAFFTREISFGSKQLSDKKKEVLYAELSALLLSGIDFRTAFDLVIVGESNSRDKGMFETVRKEIIDGSSFSEALLKSGRFGDYEYFSVRIGEETGRIGEILTDLSAYFKSKIQQRRKIISAITYPAIVMCTSMGAVLFMIKFVVPMFADVFKRFGGKLPWITSFIIEMSSMMDSLFLYLLSALVLLIVYLVLNRKQLWFRKIFSSFVLRIPIAGDIIRKIYLARFCNTMRLLVSTNTPLLRSIILVRQMIGFYPIENSLIQVEQDILRGDSLHKSLSAFGFYPPKLIQLVKVGEEVNRLDHFFEKLAVQYTDEAEHRTNTISSLLEPLIIIFLGLVVGIILIAMYLPLFQMSNSF